MPLLEASAGGGRLLSECLNAECQEDSSVQINADHRVVPPAICSWESNSFKHRLLLTNGKCKHLFINNT